MLEQHSVVGVFVDNYGLLELKDHVSAYTAKEADCLELPGKIHELGCKGKGTPNQGSIGIDLSGILILITGLWVWRHGSLFRSLSYSSREPELSFCYPC